MDCDLDADTYDVYVDGVLQATVSSRNAKTSVTHISFAQWDDGAGAFYVDNVYEVSETTYELTMAVDPTAGGTTDPTVGAHTYPESEVVAITAYANAGYEFDHWTGDVADPDSASTTVTMDGDKTVTAHFSLIPTTYELTMVVDPTVGGTTDPTIGAHTYPEDEVVPISATPNAGYEFDHWTGDVADPDSASTTVTMDGDKTVTAHFSLLPTTYELTMAVSPTAGGTTDPTVGAHTYPESEVVAITAYANAGYEFDHWEGDVTDPDAASTTVTMDGNKTVTAHFSLLPTTYELTMAVDPTGGGTTDPTVGVHTYPEDEIVAITAYASAGYEFDHWTGDVADPNSASTTVTMDGDKTVTAHFSLIPTTYELTLAVDPTGGGTTDPTVGVHTYPEDEVVTISATPNAGYEFDHWEGDVANPDAASTTVTMDGDKTVTAHFVPAGEPTCVTIQRGAFGEVADGYIWEAFPTIGKFTESRLLTGLYTHPRYGSGEARSLLRFGLGFLPGGAVIQSATLGLMQRSPGSGETVNAYRITADWNESDPPTWDFADNYDDAMVWGSFVSTGDWVTADVSGLVSDWVGGTSNYGLMLINGQTVDEYLSSDYSRNQPWLEVCYIP